MLTVCFTAKEYPQVIRRVVAKDENGKRLTFLGTSENAVKTQIWIAVCTYVLIAILKKRLKLPNSLHENLKILSLTMFETTPINQLLNPPHENSNIDFEQNQLDLL